MVTKRKDSDDMPKVREPHPLFQLGTPPTEVERSHILKIQVYRYNTGGGPPVFVTSFDRPDDMIDPAMLRAAVGGGRYQIRAQANEISGHKFGAMIHGHTNYEFDGEPVRNSPPPVAPAQPPQSFTQKLSQDGPVLMTMVTGGITAILGLLADQRQARMEQEERRAKREREEREEREKAQERRDRQEREEREAREAKRAEEAREAAEARRLAEERRAADEREARQAASQQAAEERRAAQEQSMLMFRTLLDKAAAPPQDGGMTNVLLTHVLNQQSRPVAPPVQQQPNVDQLLDAAKKLKELNESGDKEMIGTIVAAIAPTGVGQEIIARAASMVGLFPKPEPQQAPEPPPVVITPAPQPEPEPPPAVVAPQMPVEAGPVTIN